MEDITPFVIEQRRLAAFPERLLLPAERVYPVSDAAVARRIGLTAG
ncbi:hypothetical protein GCM10017781_16590 [Deinococcus metalli]|uniref:Uncharacterized protein n=1 Tax=Deinococcus metalli TaxID=1141878 RepID=A0ABQ3JR33_9DEIO|nr:hypothetical protein GCM10017781_16590 [Deinococcus metalli]